MQKRKPSAKDKQRQLQQERSLERELLQKAGADKKLTAILAFLVSLTGLALYINTLSHGFVLDDYSLILENKSTQKGFAGLKEIFTTSYRYGYILLGDELYRPLSKAVFAVLWELWPGKSAPGHWMNVVFYAGTGYLLMIVLKKYFKSVTFSFIASLLFIAHPIHTEVVANIKSLDEILSLFFNLLTLNAIYNYCHLKRLKHLILAAVFFFLALLSKESSVTFLGVFMLAWYFFHKNDSVSFFKVFASVAISFFIFMLIRRSVVGDVVSLAPSVADNLLMAAPDKLHRFTGAVYISGLYVLKLIFPHPLVFDYSYNQLPVAGPGDAGFLLAFAFFATVGIVSLIKLKSKAVWIFGALFFFITASVSSNIIITIGTSMGERLMYTPSLGFCIVIAGLVTKIFKVQDGHTQLIDHFKGNSGIYLPLSAVILLFAYKTITRNTVWKSNYTLYSNDVKLSPESTRTHYYLGNLLIKDDMHKGRTPAERDSLLRKGISELETSVAIYPAFTDAWNQMGVAYWRLKDYPNAQRCYERALKNNPNDPTVHNNLGTIYFETGNYAEALKSFTKATALKPDYADAWSNAGSVLGMMQRYSEAIPSFEKAVTYDPSNATAWHYLGITYQAIGEQAKANNAFERSKALGR